MIPVMERGTKLVQFVGYPSVCGQVPKFFRYERYVELAKVDTFPRFAPGGWFIWRFKSPDRSGSGGAGECGAMTDKIIGDE